MKEFWLLVLFNLLQFTGLSFSTMQHLNQAENRTFIVPLQHLAYFLFQTVCCRFAAVFGINVLLVTQLLAKLQLFN